MRCLLQRNFHTTVKRDVKGTLVAETFYGGKGGEIIVRLCIDEISFDITQAILEASKQSNVKTVTSLDSLVGVKAYLGSGAYIKKALHGIYDQIIVELFAETIRGVVQAETFLLEERGYASPAAYSRYWEEMYSGTCRYYSHLDRVEQRWDSYTGAGRRDGYLFTRTKNYFLYEETPETYLVCGGLSDTFHEMNITLKARNGHVVAVKGDILRVPDHVCREAVMFLNNIIGLDLMNFTKKELSGKLGKGQGCVHLIDLVYDSGRTLAEHNGSIS